MVKPFLFTTNWRSKLTPKKSAPMSSLATLRTLSNLISSSIDEIERHCNTHDMAFPSLDELFTVETEAGRADPAIATPSAIAVAAASQLIATIQPPVATFVDMACGYHRSSALQAILVSNCVECIREGGKDGLHVKEIAAKVNLNENKLGRILRFLATHHIFREVTPDVFTNNRLSSMLDTGKSLTELQAKPLERHEGTPGLAALLEHFTDEIFKGSAYMTETLVDPKTRHSTSPTEMPFNKAFHTDLDIFSWLELPENLFCLKRFGPAMNSPEKLNPTDMIVRDFEWDKLEPGAVVVDVGGGIGNTTLALRRRFPNLRYVVQDRAPVIQEGEKFWTNTLPDALTTGSIKLQAHDFMQAQPVKDAAVFLVRMVLHDWADPISEKILRHLRAAATPSTKLLVVDNILPYACPDTNDYGDIPGAKLPLPPAPLLANLGQSTAYMTDLQMIVAFNAQERTVSEFNNLFNKTGWKLIHIY